MVCPRMKTPAREVQHVTIRQALQCDTPSCVCHKPNGLLHCPAHEDKTHSLSVTEKGGKILVKRFAGSSQDRAIAALRSPPLSAPGAIFTGESGKRMKKRKNEIGESRPLGGAGIPKRGSKKHEINITGRK